MYSSYVAARRRYAIGTAPVGPVRHQAGQGILIRHGETDWNVQGCFQGQPDVPLNATGQRRAALMAARPARERFRFDAFYCSDLPHTRETAWPAAAR